LSALFGDGRHTSTDDPPTFWPGSKVFIGFDDP